MVIPAKDFAVFWTVEEMLGELCEIPRCLVWRGLMCYCPMYNVSCIFFNKCHYSSYCMAGYFLDTPHIYQGDRCLGFSIHISPKDARPVNILLKQRLSPLRGWFGSFVCIEKNGRRNYRYNLWKSFKLIFRICLIITYNAIKQNIINSSYKLHSLSLSKKKIFPNRW